MAEPDTVTKGITKIHDADTHEEHLERLKIQNNYSTKLNSKWRNKN